MLRTELIAPIPELLRRHAENQGDKHAYRDAGRAVTYAELETRTGRLAGHLVDLGIAPGDRVALLLPNSVTWVETALAVNRAGAVSVPIAFGSAEPEILYRLAHAECRAIVMMAGQHEAISRLLPRVPGLHTVIEVGGSEGSASRLRYDDLVSTPELINDDPYGDAWLIRVEMSDTSEVEHLMSAQEYKDYVEEEGEADELDHPDDETDADEDEEE